MKVLSALGFIPVALITLATTAFLAISLFFAGLLGGAK